MINTITSQLLSLYKSNNFSGFILDYSNPSIPVALLLYILNNIKKPIYLLVNNNSINYIIESNQLIKIINCNTELDAIYNTIRLCNEYKLLSIKQYDKVEIEYIKPWKKFGLCADLLPFEKMFRTDIVSLFASVIDLDKDIIKQIFELDNKEYYSDYLKVNYTELEWAYKLDHEILYNGIIRNKDNPAQHKRWKLLTTKQKQIIGILHQHHKLVLNK